MMLPMMTPLMTSLRSQRKSRNSQKTTKKLTTSRTNKTMRAGKTLIIKKRRAMTIRILKRNYPKKRIMITIMTMEMKIIMVIMFNIFAITQLYRRR